jgi:hypothetical protein
MSTDSCSFCGKARREVRKLIAGPEVWICDECIALCNDVLENWTYEQAARYREQARAARLVADDINVRFTDEARATIDRLAAELHESPAAVLELALGALAKLVEATRAGRQVIIEGRTPEETRELVLPWRAP